MSTTSTYPETSGERSSAEIEAGIRTTRERMDSTLDELGNRLSPRSIVNSVMDWWDKNSSGLTARGGMQKTYRSLTSHIKTNPVPSLLIGAGVTWLLLKDDDGEKESHREWRADQQPAGRDTVGYTSLALNDAKERAGEGDETQGGGVVDKLKEKAHEVKEVAAEAVEKVKSKVEGLTEGAEKAGKMAQDLYESGRDALKKRSHQLESGYDSAMNRMRDAVEEYPLAVGAGFAALGALIGVLLPRTRKEDQLVGRKSDEMMEAVREKGEEILEKGKEKAGEIGVSLLEEAESKGLSAEAAGEKVSGLVAKAGEVIRAAAGEAGEAVKSSAPEAEKSADY